MSFPSYSYRPTMTPMEGELLNKFKYTNLAAPNYALGPKEAHQAVHRLGNRVPTNIGGQAVDYYKQMFSDPEFAKSLQEYMHSDPTGYTTLDDLNNQFYSYNDFLGQEGHRQMAHRAGPQFAKIGDELISDRGQYDYLMLDPAQQEEMKLWSNARYDGDLPRGYKSFDYFEKQRFLPGQTTWSEDLPDDQRFDPSAYEGQTVYRRDPETGRIEEVGAFSSQLTPEEIADAYASGKAFENKIGGDFDFLRQDRLKKLIEGRWDGEWAGVQNHYNSLSPEDRASMFQMDDKGNVVGVRNDQLPLVMQMGFLGGMADVQHGFKKKDDILGPLLTVASFIPGLNVVAAPASAVYNTGRAIANNDWLGAALGGLGMYNAGAALANASNFANVNPMAMGSQVYRQFNPTSFVGKTMGLTGPAASVVGGAVFQGGLNALRGQNPLQGALQGAVNSGMTPLLQKHGFSAPVARGLTQATSGLISGQRLDPRQMLVRGGLNALGAVMQG